MAVNVRRMVIEIPIRASRSSIGIKKANQVMTTRKTLGAYVCITWKLNFRRVDKENTKTVYSVTKNFKIANLILK